MDPQARGAPSDDHTRIQTLWCSQWIRLYPALSPNTESCSQSDINGESPMWISAASMDGLGLPITAGWGKLNGRFTW